MGMLSLLFGRGNSAETFVSEAAFNENLAKQIKLSPQTVVQLAKYGVDNTTSLKLEYFFYTNSSEKAQKMLKSLIELGYSSEQKPSASNKDIYIITGWTNRIVMSEDSVVKWTELMCRAGYKFDCEFDGWGTNPKQE